MVKVDDFYEAIRRKAENYRWAFLTGEWNRYDSELKKIIEKSLENDWKEEDREAMIKWISCIMETIISHKTKANSFELFIAKKYKSSQYLTKKEFEEWIKEYERKQK